MKNDMITITRAEYAHLNKAANAAVEHALDLLKAQRMIEALEYQVADLKAAVQVAESDVSFFKERWEEAEEARYDLDAEADGYFACIRDLQALVTVLENKYIKERGRRKANLDWIAGLVAATYTLAKRTGAGEEALEELADLQDIVDETVARMLSED